MKKITCFLLFLFPLALFAQSKGRTFGQSILLPGWGHYTVQNHAWKGKASLYALSDAALWIGLATTIQRENRFTQSYQTLAATQAGAKIADKDRAFFVSLAGFASSTDRVKQLQASRNWSAAEEAAKPENAWLWTSTTEQELYAQTRNRAEAMRRQKPMLIGLLIGNRVLSGVTSVLALRQKEKSAKLAFSLEMSHIETSSPILKMSIRF